MLWENCACEELYTCFWGAEGKRLVEATLKSTEDLCVRLRKQIKKSNRFSWTACKKKDVESLSQKLASQVNEIKDFSNLYWQQRDRNPDRQRIHRIGMGFLLPEVARKTQASSIALYESCQTGQLDKFELKMNFFDEAVTSHSVLGASAKKSIVFCMRLREPDFVVRIHLHKTEVPLDECELSFK